MSQKLNDLAVYIDTPHVQNQIKAACKEASPSFISTLLTVVGASEALQACTPQSIVDAALYAAQLGLSIVPKLNQAYIVPGKGYKAEFRMGWRGYVQLAIGTGLYRHVGAAPVYANQFKSYNSLSGAADFDMTVDGIGEPIGYAAYLELIPREGMREGFQRTEYWNVGKILAHGKKYSPNFGNPNSKWQTDFPSMALKTVVRSLFDKWGVMSSVVAIDNIDLDGLDEVVGDFGEVTAPAATVSAPATTTPPEATPTPNPAAEPPLPFGKLNPVQQPPPVVGTPASETPAASSAAAPADAAETPAATPKFAKLNITNLI